MRNSCFSFIFRYTGQQEAFTMQYSLYDLILLFFIYAFLGWCSEVAFAAIKTGHFVNRGFLNGPICPIYGFGVVGCIVALTPLADHIFVLFFASMILTSALEFVTGWVLEKAFHTKWWDYTNTRFNIKGYICLEFSIMWGFAATFIMKLIHPMIYHLVQRLPVLVGRITIGVLLAVAVVDLAATIATVRNFRKRLGVLTRLASDIHDVSDSLGDTISDATLAIKSRTDETQERYSDYTEMVRAHRAEEKALAEAHRAEEQVLWAAARASGREAHDARAEEFRAKLAEKSLLQNRILRAFPTMRSERDQEALTALRRFQLRKKGADRPDEPETED
jgi:uncharacterized membrane protein